jgi:RND family efflux transporter MFP subunit
VRGNGWGAIAIAIAMAVAGGAGCHRGNAANEEPGTGPKRVRCAPVEVRDVQDSVELHGTVAPLPDRDSQIAAQVPGRILRVVVREGDTVTSGQALAHIDDAALADQAKQAAAQLAKARAEAGLATVSRDRIKRVFDRGIAARQELDDAEARLATAHAGEAEARAAAEIANRQVERAVVRSPLPGVVLRLFRRSGELVDGTPATPIVEVGDPTRLELVASATAAELVQARAGAPAAVELPALPDSRLAGSVSAVSPAVDRTTGLGVVRVRLDLPAGLRPPVGIAGNARIPVGAPRRAALVPAAALRAARGNEAEVVVCGTDGRAHVTAVRRGLSVGAMVEARPAGADGGGASAPLAAGIAVAVEPVLGIAEGDALEIAR